MKRSQSFSDAFQSLSLSAHEIKSSRSSFNYGSREKNNESTSKSSRTSSRAASLSPESMKLAKEALYVESAKRNDTEIESICYIFIELFLLENLSHEHKLLASKIARLSKFPPNTKITDKNHEFEHFYVVISGNLIFQSENNDKIYYIGDTFGSTPRTDSPHKEICQGILSTLQDPCEVLTIDIFEFERVLKSSEFFEISQEDGSSVEASFTDNILTSATVDKILDMLLDEKYHNDEPTFTHDFFLTYPIYIHDPAIIVAKIRDLFDKDIHNQRVIAVLLSWLDICPHEFSEPFMTDFIIYLAEKLKTTCCALSFSLIETIYLRSLAFEIRFSIKIDDDVPIRIKYRTIQESHTKYKLELYVTNIDASLCSKKSDLKLYDEIIFFNDMDVHELKIQQVRLKIKSVSNFILIVKRCPIKYEYVKNELRDLYETADSSLMKNPSFTEPVLESVADPDENHSNSHPSISRRRHNPTNDAGKGSLFSGFTLRKNKKIRMNVKSIIEPGINLLSNSSLRDIGTTFLSGQSFPYDSVNHQFDLLSTLSADSNEKNTEKSNFFVMRFYMPNHETRYVTISRTDTCKKIISDYFNSNFRKPSNTVDSSQTITPLPLLHIFSAKMTNNLFKFSMLHDDHWDLPHKIQPGNRYYIARTSSEVKFNSEIEAEILAESMINFKSFNHSSFAKILTFNNFNKFSHLTPTEYLGTIFKKVQCNCENLNNFEKMFDKEMNWVVYEILHEPAIRMRAKIITKFIKIADKCLALHNFNTFFSIIQGLDHMLISRLKSTWELVPVKHVKNYRSLLTYCDVSQNMSNYRAWLLKWSVDSKRDNKFLMVPLIPIIKKDLTFINDSSETYISSTQINYRKIRQIAKEMRKIAYFRDRNFSLIKSFEVKNRKSSVLLSSPSLSIPIYNKDSSIMLSDVSSDILRFLSIENFSSGDFSSFSTTQSHNKRIFEEYMEVKKIFSYIQNIDNLKFDQEEFRTRSYSIEPLKRKITQNTTLETGDAPSFSPASIKSANAASTNSLMYLRKSSNLAKGENVTIKVDEPGGTLLMLQRLVIYPQVSEYSAY